MQKQTLWGIIAVGIIAGGIVLYAVRGPVPANTAEAPTLSGGRYTEHATYYDILANYPADTPLRTSVNAAADAAAVALMKNFVSDTIVQFKTDGKFDRLTPTDISMMGFDKGRRETLKIVYLMASSPRTASFAFTTYVDTLGAHGNTFFHTFMFDTVTGARLTLRDLFVPGADYLSKLSEEARARLPAIIGNGADTSMIAAGTAPEDKNFSAFLFDNRDLLILFAPYAVAPYSAGPQTLRIPTSNLKDILKPEYR